MTSNSFNQMKHINLFISASKKNLADAQTRMVKTMSEGFYLDSFAIEAIISTQASLEVATALKIIMNGHPDYLDGEMIEAIRIYSTRQVLSHSTPQSTSPADNIMKNALHENWIRIAEMITPYEAI